MHPKQLLTVVGDEDSKQRKGRGKGTAVVRYHAEALASYIKSLFLDSTLLDQRVEAGWKLGGREEKTMAFNHWVRFQTLFMERWPVFTRLHEHDQFWKDNLPAFHAYDYGANIEIEVTEQLRSLGPEVPLRPVDDEDEDSASASDGGSESEREARDRDEPMVAGAAIDEVSSQCPDTAETEQEVEEDSCGEEGVAILSDASQVGVGGTRGDCDGCESVEREDWAQLVENDLFVSSEDGDVEQERDNEHWARAATAEADDGLYSEGLKQLRIELEQKYDPDSIDVISYALAVNIKCECPVEAGREQSMLREESPSGESICLLADRNHVAKQYSSKNGFTFYPLGFHPAYGNFTSAEPPRFLANGPLAIMKDNMSFQNDGGSILDAGYWQAYNNIKTLIRHTSEDLLATRGSATAALTIPATDAASRAQTRKAQQTLLERIRGGLTPGNPDASTPFARERQRVEAAIAGQGYDFRLEQVLSVHVKRLIPEQRTFATVLHPIFGLMRFFLKERDEYLGLLRQFPPVAFPGVLAGFAKVFELALGEMDERFREEDSRGLGLALSEGVAALDRLGNFCFTGDPTVLPTRVLRPLKTVDSLREGGWPFIWPDMLDIREGRGIINLRKWPRRDDRKPILMHVASLAFHYGGQVAANRESQLWFSELGGSVIRGLGSLGSFVEEVFRTLWKDDMISFVSYQIQQRLNRGVRGGQVSFVADQARITEARKALDKWELCWNPFSLGYVWTEKSVSGS